MTINGKQVNRLLDTGSQVTTVPHSFYEQHLAEQEIKPLHDLLEVVGANGQSVPYQGYIEMTVVFPQALTAQRILRVIDQSPPIASGAFVNWDGNVLPY